jgi:hypothetical protein
VPDCVFILQKTGKLMWAPFVLLNLFTWPLLHYLMLTTRFSLPLMEIGVAGVEMIGYKILLSSSWTKSFAVSFAANAFSYGVGVLINHFL